jgi:hypothetical protein
MLAVKLKICVRGHANAKAVELGAQQQQQQQQRSTSACVHAGSLQKGVHVAKR